MPWVPNTHNQDSMTTDLDVDVYTVPYAFDVDRYDSVYRKLDMGDNGKFKFYYVGDVNSRKNIETLIKCWNVAWDVEGSFSFKSKQVRYRRTASRTYDQHD